jgi:hypothetical protein
VVSGLHRLLGTEAGDSVNVLDGYDFIHELYLLSAWPCARMRRTFAC